jgi:malonyl-CoA/methylmalonyl-CoA synthetase
MTNHLFALMRTRMPAADRTFIETPARGASGGHLLSYGDAMALSARVANLLVERGVTPGDRVAVQLEKSPEAIVLYLACVRAGAVYLPLNTAYTLAELDYFVGDAEPRVVVCAPDKQAAIEPLARAKGVAAVETLGTRGDGTLMEAAQTR